jgi:alpha-tubulin suppressor-like RCC1 family protein
MTPLDTSLILNSSISVKKVACGGYFAVVLLSDRRVFSVGENSLGECGHVVTKSIKELTEVKAARELNVVDINCGYHFTVVTCGLSNFTHF